MEMIVATMPGSESYDSLANCPKKNVSKTKGAGAVKRGKKRDGGNLQS